MKILRSAWWLSLSLVALGAVGCGGGEGSAPAASGVGTGGPAPGGSAAGVTSAAVTATAAPAAGPATIVELGSGAKAVKLSVVLPPGISEQPSPGGGFKMFRKGDKDFDGYNITLGADRGGATLALFETQILAQKDAKKARILAKETFEGGWALAYEFEEGKKMNVGLMSNITVGGALYLCRGDATGSALTDVDAAAKVLIATCRSLKPAS